MSNTTLTNLLKDYEKKKYNADLDFEERKTAFYASHPDLSSLNSKLGKIRFGYIKSCFKR